MTTLPLDYKDTEQVQRRLVFERTVSVISSRFVMLTEDLKSSIQTSLEDMAKLSDASRAYIFEFDEPLLTMSNTYEWCAQGISDELENLQNLPTDIFPWWMQKLKSNEIILIPDINDMPPEASAEHDILAPQGIQSLLVLPIYIKGILFGYIGFDSVTKKNIWHEEDVALLRIVSEIFASAFQRLSYEDALRKHNQELTKNLEEIKRLQGQLIQQEKMVGIGQLAAGIAHEINNPIGFVSSNYEVLYKYSQRIQNILGIVKRLLTELGEPTVKGGCHRIADELQSAWQQYKIDNVLEDMMDLLDDSKIGFERVSEIVMALRNFAHTDTSSSLEQENLHNIIEEVLVILNNEIKYYAEIEKNYEPIPLVKCHRGQIGQVLINILINSVHALRKSSTASYGHLKIKTYQEESFVCLEISDNGIGIPSHVVPQIFNPFFTTKDIGEGTGLGLSISYDIVVNKHKGDILVQSIEGEGTTFTLKLPVQ